MAKIPRLDLELADPPASAFRVARIIGKPLEMAAILNQTFSELL